MKYVPHEYQRYCINRLVAKNTDGSLCAHIPVAWIRISPPAARTEAQRKEIAERFKRK